jgi:hypothetical protein
MTDKREPIELDVSQLPFDFDIGFNLARDSDGGILGVRVRVRTETGELLATDLLPLYPAIAKKEA